MHLGFGGVGLLGMMTVEELMRGAAGGGGVPGGLTEVEQALWLARAGEWDAAHDLCQDLNGRAGFWVHGWLHRQEGDLVNAGYWYGRAGEEMPGGEVSDEDAWVEMARALTGGGGGV